MKHSAARHRAISLPIKAPVMEVKWPVCSCLKKKLNGWFYIAMLSVSDGLSGLMHFKPDVSGRVPACGGEREREVQIDNFSP